MRTPLISSLLLALVASACGADFTDDDTLGAAAGEEQALVVVSLQFNDSVLRVHGDQTFTLEDRDGTVLAARIDRDQLGEIAPGVARRYDRMVAGGSRGVLDASVDPWLLAPEGGLGGTAGP